jgi:photosystem II stability/assembly factor-like uncharacterized protein
MRILIIFLLLVNVCNFVHAQVQVPQHIAEKLRFDKTFAGYARAMTNYLDSQLAATRDSSRIAYLNKQYKFLARQLYYLESHQGANNEIVNVSEQNMRALQEYQQSPLAQLESPHLGSWTLVGPSSVSESYGTRGIGRVDRIAFHPTVASTIFAGTPAGGLWKSTNAGLSWSSVDKYLPSLGVSGIVVSHAAPSTIYVLTGDGDSNLGSGGFVEGFDYIRPSIGVLKSTDDGETWTRTALNIPGFYVGYKLVQSPTDANVLLAATSKGLYRTGNGGNSWDLVSADSSRYYDIEWKPGSSATVYACTRNQFFMSVSAGQTFAHLTNRIPEDISAGDRIALAVTPNNDDVLYVLVGENKGNSVQSQRIFRSTNSGGTFFLRSTLSTGGGAVQYMLNIAASPTNYNYVAVGSLTNRFSEDGASTFVRSSQEGNDAQDNYVHADIHELTYHPVTGVLHIGSDGGAYQTDDHGVTFVQKFSGMSASQFYHFDVADSDENLVIAGAQDNGIMYKTTNTTSFRNYKDGDGFDIATPHGYGNFIVVTVNTNTYFFHKSFPSEYWYLNLQNNVWYKPVATSWFDSTKFAGGTETLRWRSFSSSVNVSSYNNNARWALTTSPSNGDRLYSAGGPNWNAAGLDNERSLTRSDDGGETWTQLRNNPGLPDSIGKITSIAVHPENSTRVCITMGGYRNNIKVYFSSTAGTTWVNYSAGLPNVPVNVAVINDNGDIYIGTDIGVFYRTETSGWMPFFNGLPKVPVTDLRIRNGIVFASTFGRGIWSTSVHGNCSPSLNLTAELSGRIFYEAGTITATSTIVNTAGTEIYMKAANEATFSPGFVANGSRGAEFRTWIAPCGSGGVPLRVSLPDKNVTPVAMADSANVFFNLSFPALVRIYAVDSAGMVLNELHRPVRLQTGKNSLPLGTVPAGAEPVLVIDGDVIAINRQQ